VACEKREAIFPFTMAFQPIVDIERRDIHGYEALVRGPAGEGAATILAQVDGTNIYAFDQACRTQAIGLAAKLGLDRSLSINFLPNAIYDPKACLRHTLKAASRHNFPHHLLTFEIVETEGLADPAHLAAIVTEYRSHGFKIALDDFGTGYSGLARLADLKPDILKVDRVLVKDCDRNAMRRRILANLLALGRDVGTDIVLEGVETEAEMETLRAIGGRLMQGFYFARPALETLVSRESIGWPAVARIDEPAL
jgi:EAL domain-containing protein (putative c-di-GMP-specific phosphodiesterase class I)